MWVLDEVTPTRGLWFKDLIPFVPNFYFFNFHFHYQLLRTVFTPPPFFLFSSPKLKAQVSFSDRPLSGVRLSVNSSFPEPLGQF
jgi:hypothetical protein